MSESTSGISFNDWWNCQGDWVEPPNVRRGGESGVQRVAGENGVLCYAKRQVGHLHRTLQHPLGRPTIVRETKALRAWARLGVRVPQVLYSGA
jgi:tRNA A-37 threonylcarbamoyl transferase component Bud32